MQRKNQCLQRRNNSIMELQFRGIDAEEKEYIHLLPAWAYSKEEIKNLLEQHILDQKLFYLLCVDTVTVD